MGLVSLETCTCVRQACRLHCTQFLPWVVAGPGIQALVLGRAAQWKYGGTSLNPGVSSELHFGKQTSVRFDIPVGALGVGCGQEGLLPVQLAQHVFSRQA